MGKQYKEQLIHVTLIARAANGIWYICAELFAQDFHKVKLISSTVVPLQEVADWVKRLYSVEINPQVSLN